MQPIKLTKPQYQALHAKQREIYFVGGLGSGKSFLGALWVYKRVIVRCSIGAILAPTYGVLQTATLQQIKSAWSLIGILEGVDYVIGKIPFEWTVKKYGLKSTNILQFRNGSVIILDSLHNYNKFRGVELDYIFVDEWRDVKEEAYTVLVGRLRGKAFKTAGIKHQMLCCTTPPDNPLSLREHRDRCLRGEIDGIFISSPTMLNKHNLPDGYIESMEKSYDPITFRREVLGELELQIKNQFMYAFDKQRHVNSEATYNPMLPVYLSFDFNVNPICCAVFQHIDSQYIYQIDEFRIENGNTEQLATAILQRYPNQRFIVTGDATGRARSTLTTGNLNNYDIIKRILSVYNGFKVPPSNPSVADTYVLCNSIFHQHQKFYIHPKCIYTIQDLLFVRYDFDKKEIMKELDSKQSHLLDCVRYFLNTFYGDWFKKRLVPRPNALNLRYENETD